VYAFLILQPRQTALFSRHVTFPQEVGGVRSYWNHSDRTLLLERVQRLNADSPRRWGKMTCHQMVCHVGDAFRVAMKEIDVTPRGGLEWFVRWPALYLPVAWPHGYPAPKELDQLGGLGRTPVEFVRDRDELLSVMARFASGTERLSRHPLWGKMTEWEWGRWGYLHTDHHLRQFGV
jgi:hypothetical protein